MSEIRMLAKEMDYRTAAHARGHEGYAERNAFNHSPQWKSLPVCQPKWKKKVYRRSVTQLNTRSHSDELGSAIDKLYDQLANLVARRSDHPNPTLEEKISASFQRLRALQKKEGDLIRETIKSEITGPIAAGLNILEQADEIKARYGSTSATNTSSQDTDASET